MVIQFKSKLDPLKQGARKFKMKRERKQKLRENVNFQGVNKKTK